MEKAILLAKKISKHPFDDFSRDLFDVNIHKIFEPIFQLGTPDITANIIVSFIILAYDNDSTWLNLKQDRLENKQRILKSLTDDYTSVVLQSVVKNEYTEVNDVIANYLIEQTTWKWQTIMTLLDYHANMIRFSNQKTESEKSVDKMNKEGEVKTLSQEYDIDTITKVNKQKGELLEQAIEAREKADKLLADIRREFVNLDNAVQQDFGFSISDEKKINPESWRDFIRHTKPEWESKKSIPN